MTVRQAKKLARINQRIRRPRNYGRAFRVIRQQQRRHGLCGKWTKHFPQFVYVGPKGAH